MPTAVIADVHANLAALEAVLSDLGQSNISEIICLGDMIGYGPDPEEVLTELRKQNIIAVMGNHEYALLNAGYYRRLNPDPKSSLDINRAMLSEDSLAYCRTLKTVLTHQGARLVHGCPPRSQTAYLYYPNTDKLSKIFASFSEQICFFGHTHNLSFFELGKPPEKSLAPLLGHHKLRKTKRYIINPGSVGQPRDNINNHAKYLIWDQDESAVIFKSVQYDVTRTVNKLKQNHFPSFNAERLL